MYFLIIIIKNLNIYINIFNFYLKTANFLQVLTSFIPTNLLARSINSSTTKFASFLTSSLNPIGKLFSFSSNLFLLLLIVIGTFFILIS